MKTDFQPITYTTAPAVTAILKQYPRANAHTKSEQRLNQFQTDMYAAQVQLIEYRLPRMSPADRQRAMQTIDWLQAQPGVVDRLLTAAPKETQP